MNEIINYLDKYYKRYHFNEQEIESLIQFIKADKKNNSGKYFLTLLPTIGQVETLRECSEDDIFEALKKI